MHSLPPIAEVHRKELESIYDDRVRGMVDQTLEHQQKNLENIMKDYKPDEWFEQRRILTRVAINNIQKTIRPNLYLAHVLGRYRSKPSLQEGKPLDLRRDIRPERKRDPPRRSEPEKMTPTKFREFVAATEKQVVELVRKKMHALAEATDKDVTGLIRKQMGDRKKEVVFQIDADELHNLLLKRMVQAFAEGERSNREDGEH